MRLVRLYERSEAKLQDNLDMKTYARLLRFNQLLRQGVESGELDLGIEMEADKEQIKIDYEKEMQELTQQRIK